MLQYSLQYKEGAGHDFILKLWQLIINKITKKQIGVCSGTKQSLRSPFPNRIEIKSLRNPFPRRTFYQEKQFYVIK